ncbi:hypothetical protein Corgl_1599 [Coriobacterium glomerans PW2]|uniref:Peptidase S9 prolyl oligopeptidase catalytic domain-containing protein n=1 Tax=Coriobacterium glomerans (strain ATCC 49209 / DSM 20642 / JCM 10262 / PW2) TaxID=700015 RepID=F2N922_CORGP|nr:PHB depolymerase family esterase [Coriobacterium glomerans]AEB07698.1 hypothetical protein Corgl_1599 [Coriobacterium glomerans PW2]
MQSRIIYTREITADGDQVICADIKLNKKFHLNDSQVYFQVRGERVPITSIDCSGRDVHVDFARDSRLATFSFDQDDFVNRFALPEIEAFLELGKSRQSSFLISFREPAFFRDFSSFAFQYGNGCIGCYQYATGTSATKRPLVVFLHGSGERGLADWLPLIGNDVPQAIHDYIMNHEDAVLLVPQVSWTPELSGWFRPEIRDALIRLIDAVIEEENIDTSRIYLAGLSNGGAATWHFAERHPDMFAAIVPCCGYIYNDEKSFLGDPGGGRYMEPTQREASRLNEIPIWAFHAEDDSTVDVRGTRSSVAAVKSQGNRHVRMTIYEPGLVRPNPHASWKLAFKNSDLLPWMFSQRRR